MIQNLMWRIAATVHAAVYASVGPIPSLHSMIDALRRKIGVTIINPPAPLVTATIRVPDLFVTRIGSAGYTPTMDEIKGAAHSLLLAGRQFSPRAFALSHIDLSCVRLAMARDRMNTETSLTIFGLPVMADERVPSGMLGLRPAPVVEEIPNAHAR